RGELGVPAAPAPITGPVAPVSSPVVPVPIQQAPEISPDLISSLNQMNVKIPNTSGVGANPQGPFANPK
ncbi:MAG: hypothetical protein M0T74_06235, partial [Desulfitobacterium hafniense]|nr:hypothetical protein [Desulfitobacterium hafniense]